MSKKEKLIDIVRSIKSCADTRKNLGIFCVARVHCIYNGEWHTFWFTSSNANGSMHGLHLDGFGDFVPKNSFIAIKLQTNEIGSTFEYSMKNIHNRHRVYHVSLENRSNFQNQTIEIADDSIVAKYQYRNIKEFLNDLQKNWVEIVEIETEIGELNQKIVELKKQKQTAQQRASITRTINVYKDKYRIATKQKEDIKDITIYIRKQGEMRYSLIVDTKQTKVKTQNLYDGKTVVIDGGPGTGKSTTMIHRLAYLTDKLAITEDFKNKLNLYKLTPSYRNKLLDAIDAQRDWMFFSPSQLLRDYLAEAMKKEGLINCSEKVWSWKEYCRLILQENYQLLESSLHKAPFKLCYFTETLFYQHSNIVGEFTNFYVSQLNQFISQLPDLALDGTAYKWITIAKQIKKKIQNGKYETIGNFVSLFHSLASIYGDECKRILIDNNLAIVTFSNEICCWLEQHKELKDDIICLLEITSQFHIGLENQEEMPEEDETGRSVEDTDELLAKELQKWLKAYCLSRIDGGTKFSDEYQMISELLEPFMGEEKHASQINKIGELIVFGQYARYTRGVCALMFNGIGERYKKFRRYLISIQYKGCNMNLLSKLVQNKSGKELHYQEQSLLLGFINNLVKQIKAGAMSAAKHMYINAYDELARPIIGIDEATDFSACDIYAMQSLLTREFNSFTLCGDIMQRLTTSGIKSWSELDGIVPNYTIETLNKSYRQSHKLLALAKQLYQDTIGVTPNYKAFLDLRKVPDALVFVDEDEHAKIQWISKRIEEVHRHYGNQHPSIAVFVNDKGYISNFIERIQQTAFFTTHSIRILDGSNLPASKPIDNYIAVYPIEVVKGMEFDVVFFHNIDNSSVDAELLKRYIYVGVSRAAFFLAVTMIEDRKEISKYFQKNTDWYKI